MVYIRVVGLNEFGHCDTLLVDGHPQLLQNITWLVVSTPLEIPASWDYYSQLWTIENLPNQTTNQSLGVGAMAAHNSAHEIL